VKTTICKRCGKRIPTRMIGLHAATHQGEDYKILWLMWGAPTPLIKAAVRILKARFHPDSPLADSERYEEVVAAGDRLLKEDG